MTGIQGVWRAASLAIVVLATATSCTEMTNDSRATVDWERAHKINVTSHFVTTPIEVSSDSSALAPVEQAKLAKMVADFIQVGGGAMEVATPKGTGDNEQALARAEVVRNHVLRLGALPREVAIRISDIGGEGPVVVSYERFTALPPTCRPMDRNMAFNPGNLPPDTFGCATQRNLAEMISNPADLVRMRQGRSNDATRRTKAVRDYRTGTE